MGLPRYENIGLIKGIKLEAQQLVNNIIIYQEAGEIPQEEWDLIQLMLLQIIEEKYLLSGFLRGLILEPFTP